MISCGWKASQCFSILLMSARLLTTTASLRPRAKWSLRIYRSLRFTPWLLLSFPTDGEITNERIDLAIQWWERERRSRSLSSVNSQGLTDPGTEAGTNFPTNRFFQRDVRRMDSCWALASIRLTFVSLEVFVGVFWLSSRLRTRRHSRSETKRRSLRSQVSLGRRYLGFERHFVPCLACRRGWSFNDHRLPTNLWLPPEGRVGSHLSFSSPLLSLWSLRHSLSSDTSFPIIGYPMKRSVRKRSVAKIETKERE